jgi:hypothetical protein
VGWVQIPLPSSSIAVSHFFSTNMGDGGQQKSRVPQTGSGTQIPLWAAYQARTGNEAENL